MRGVRGLVLIVVAAAVPGAGAPATFLGAGGCRPCHVPEFETWKASAHAGATASIQGADGYGPECLKCHATDASEVWPGVQCEACHGAGSAYASIATMMDKPKAFAAGLLVQDQKLCDGCHDGQDHRSRVVLGKYRHDHRGEKEAVDLN